VRRGWKGARYQEKGSSREARKAFNIKVDYVYLNPDYDLKPLQDNEITEQGLLLCGKLKPQQPLLPEFWIRWDEKGDHLNVDMQSDKGCQDDWENETHGYKGHRSQKASDRPGRAFNLLITTPDLKVFEGVISFNVARDVKATVTIGVHASADVHDVRG
jgi:hypothetical protein